jgi:dolichol kinase
MQTRFCGLRLNIKLAIYRAERRSVRLGVEVVPFGRAKENMGVMEKRWEKVFSRKYREYSFPFFYIFSFLSLLYFFLTIEVFLVSVLLLFYSRKDHDNFKMNFYNFKTVTS